MAPLTNTAEDAAARRALAQAAEAAAEKPGPGRRFHTAEGLAAFLDAEIGRAQRVVAHLRAHPPTDDSRDLDRATIAAEGVRAAVTTLDRALGWREG